MAPQQGWQIEGIEINKQLTTMHKKYSDKKYSDKKFNQIREISPTRKFQFISSWHILEHI